MTQTKKKKTAIEVKRDEIQKPKQTNNPFFLQMKKSDYMKNSSVSVSKKKYKQKQKGLKLMFLGALENAQRTL